MRYTHERNAQVDCVSLSNKKIKTMKLHLHKTLILAITASSAVYAETTYGNSVVYEAGTQLIQETLNVSNTSYDGGAASTVRYKKDVTATDCQFKSPASSSGTMYFDANATFTNCVFTTGNGGGSINFLSQAYGKKLALKGGNKFYSYDTQGINILSGTNTTATAEGNNEFYGATNVNKLKVISGTQKFENKMTDSAQTMSFSNIGFAENANDTAAIEVSADQGQVFFRDNCEISSLDMANSKLRVWDTLVVRNSVTFGEGVTFDWGRTDSEYKFVDGQFTKVETYTPATLVLEIDSIAELMDQTMPLTLDGEGNAPMLSVDDGVDMSNAKVGLYFTENALAEMAEMEAKGSNITLNLDKVTNVNGLELELAVDESTGKTVEEVFGTTSFTTKEYNTGNNNITLGENVPEPTTATLSLLALAALAGRRRRK